jgi:hypothetical protein
MELRGQFNFLVASLPKEDWTIRKSENYYHCRDSKSDPSVVQSIASRVTVHIQDKLLLYNVGCPMIEVICYIGQGEAPH